MTRKWWEIGKRFDLLVVKSLSNSLENRREEHFFYMVREGSQRTLKDFKLAQC